MNTDDHRLVLLYESMKIDRRVSKVIIIQSGKILLLQKTGSLLWELPGGHAKQSEKMSKAACREVKEETGIRCDPSRLVKIQSDTKNGTKANIYKYTEPVKLKVKLSDEHVNYKWVSKHKLDNYKLSPVTNHLAIISSYDM